MTGPQAQNQDRVLRWVQDILMDELDEQKRAAITPALIGQKIDQVVAMRPAWGDGLHREAVVDELIRRFSVWVGQDTLLKSEEGHIAWLNTARKSGWRYWRRYEEWMERKISPTAVQYLGESTDAVLGLLEDPLREGTWDRRGLVVGHVQSGKTGHYSGLICKGADAGYKVIIVLAGLHNNLRSQTQIRLDEGFLGFETQPGTEDLKRVGVGEIDTDLSIRPNFATNRSERGDFNTTNARLVGITPEQRPWLFVVKKNRTPLDRLLHWIRNRVADARDPETGRPLVTKLPLLLIDDEADHASVDTGEQVFDAEGMPDEEHSPTAINSRIRKILSAFTRSAYVGYTATPFANIFIHERGTTSEEGPDLFPAAFILNLAAPSNYIGPAKVFGARSADGRAGGLPLIRFIKDVSNGEGNVGWMPSKHKSNHPPRYLGEPSLPPSLVEAIDAFLLACAVRVVRGHGKDHSSMLIHVTRFKDVQKEVVHQVKEHVHRIHQRLTRGIEADGILARMKDLWVRDFIPSTKEILGNHPELANQDLPDWEEIHPVLPEVLGDIQVKTINGSAKDTLDYAESAALGSKVIAVGGDKLSRGLTLEGLCTSYFLRASRMYDTLMQMGRWFGYRPGYLDLCRLYTTGDLVEWFGHIADASEELREEFEMMVATGSTPRAYGLKVQSHPVLTVTSRLKMRAAKDLWLSFCGDISETVVFFKDRENLANNVRALLGLIDGMGKPTSTDPMLTRDGIAKAWPGYVWDGVPSDQVIGFLSAYRTHPEAHKTISFLLSQFIQSMNQVGELTSWTVGLVGSGKGSAHTFRDGINIRFQMRKDKGIPGRYSIGRLLDPPDETVDLDEVAWDAALQATVKAFHADPGRNRGNAKKEPPTDPSGPWIRRIRGMGSAGLPGHPERGVLLIYTLDPMKAESDFTEETPPVVGFGISFPDSKAGKKVRYSVNNVLWQQWEQEYGASE